jgi:hypothetical protein
MRRFAVIYQRMRQACDACYRPVESPRPNPPPRPAQEDPCPRSTVTTKVAHEAMTTSRRYGGQEALAAGIADRTADEQSVRTAAAELAAAQAAKAGPALGTIKSRLYAPVVAALRDKDIPLG